MAYTTDIIKLRLYFCNKKFWVGNNANRLIIGKFLSEVLEYDNTILLDIPCDSSYIYTRIYEFFHTNSLTEYERLKCKEIPIEKVMGIITDFYKKTK